MRNRDSILTTYIRMVQIALLFASLLLIWVIIILVFFQNWLSPATGCAVVDKPSLICGTFAIKNRVALTDSIALAGKGLFEANCIACHSTTSDIVVGPGLKGLEERRDSVWIARFVQNSTKVIESGDKYAVELFEKYNKSQMTTFNFTDAEVWAILRYIRLTNTPLH